MIFYLSMAAILSASTLVEMAVGGNPSDTRLILAGIFLILANQEAAK